MSGGGLSGRHLMILGCWSRGPTGECAGRREFHGQRARLSVLGTLPEMFTAFGQMGLRRVLIRVIGFYLVTCSRESGERNKGSGPKLERRGAQPCLGGGRDGRW